MNSSSCDDCDTSPWGSCAAHARTCPQAAGKGSPFDVRHSCAAEGCLDPLTAHKPNAEAEIARLKAELEASIRAGEQQFDAGVAYSGLVAKLRAEMEERDERLRGASRELANYVNRAEHAEAELSRLTEENERLRDEAYDIADSLHGVRTILANSASVDAEQLIRGIDAVLDHRARNTPGACGYSSLPGLVCTRRPGHGGQHHVAFIERPAGDSE